MMLDVKEGMAKEKYGTQMYGTVLERNGTSYHRTAQCTMISDTS